MIDFDSSWGCCPPLIYTWFVLDFSLCYVRSMCRLLGWTVQRMPSSCPRRDTRHTEPGTLDHTLRRMSIPCASLNTTHKFRSEDTGMIYSSNFTLIPFISTSNIYSTFFSHFWKSNLYNSNLEQISYDNGECMCIYVCVCVCECVVSGFFFNHYLNVYGYIHQTILSTVISEKEYFHYMHRSMLLAFQALSLCVSVYVCSVCVYVCPTSSAYIIVGYLGIDKT